MHLYFKMILKARNKKMNFNKNIYSKMKLKKYNKLEE